MKIFLIYLLIGVFTIGFPDKVMGQESDQDFKIMYYKSVDLYRKGDLDASESNLLLALNNTDSLKTNQFIALNNMLGILRKNFGDYENAINHYNTNLEFLNSIAGKYPKKKSKTLSNLGNIYQLQMRYLKAIEYFEMAMVVIKESNLETKEKFLESEYIYYNLAIVYYYIRDYDKAIEYYNKSLSIKKKFNLKGIDKVYFNLARTYAELNQFTKADYYFFQAIKFREKLYGKDYHRTAPLYMFYGNFLRKQGEYDQSIKYLKKAKKVYEQNYGERHPYTANSYVYLGDYYTSVSEYDSALFWYQRSLIANSKQFKSDNIYKNPDSDECFSGLQLLKGLKKKAKALQNIANIKSGDKQTELYKLSIKTVNIAVNLISVLRNDYISSDSKLIITEEEKECYCMGVKSSTDLYKIINDSICLEIAYKFAAMSKASVMNSDFEYEREIIARVPEPERNKKTDSEKKISAYKKLIFEENERLKPDSSKINLWKSQLFRLNKEYETFIEGLNANYQISANTDKYFISLENIKNNLPEQTTLVEYFISKDEESENQHLYIFVINNEGFWQFNRELSDLFEQNIESFMNRMNDFNQAGSDIKSFNQFNKVCYGLYLELIEPIKHVFNGQNIIIVPDEKIAYISFEALLPEFKEYSNINYADLSYLIYDYCFSYAYSTPLLMNNKQNKNSDFVYAFAPDYIDNNRNLSNHQFKNLSQIKNEIESILEHFNGNAFIGNKADESSFKSITDKGGILHLAMHAFNEEDKNEFSFLAFSNNQKTKSGEDGLLYAYEIDQMKIVSPLAVLSACNTGKGRLCSGEGVISLSRSFLKAGVPAVINSLWNVNDETGSKIMQYFYENLAKGKTKNNALREAKLRYMKESYPTLLNPFYWSGYVLTGDVSAVKKPMKNKYLLYGTAILLLIIISIVLRRRNKIKN